MSPALRDRLLALFVALLGAVALWFWSDVNPAGSPSNPIPDEPSEPAEPDTPDEPTSEPKPSPLVDGMGDEVLFSDPGDLVEDSGQGVTSDFIYSPSMVFPIEFPRAFSNSQVYGVGGLYGPAGGQCDAENYSYPWRDNYCENRGYTTVLCPSGTGHQGQDIRPPQCPAGLGSEGEYYAVAVSDGYITAIHRHVMTLTDGYGRQYKYLHLDPDTYQVEAGDAVVAGQRLGVVSNYFGTTPTTYHLHFEIRQSVEMGPSFVMTPVPPYTSLVAAYKRQLEADE